jgi:RNase P subunit RPR2
MVKRRPPAPEEDPPIETERLPVICPACGHREPRIMERTTLLAAADGTRTPGYDVHCDRCGWWARYVIVPRSVLLAKNSFH